MQAATGTAGSFLASPFLMILLVFIIAWFFMIRPQQKRQKEIQKFRNSIAVGQNIVTAGGIYGTVRAIDETDNALIIEVANGVKIKVDRNSVYAQAQPTQ
ncbi:MAG: preprotein translocase subunit YajC [Bacteroidaceae bacterium]|nr:preprotein translocase subunit YajC [Bacteroidaceae bacterium]